MRTPLIQQSQEKGDIEGNNLVYQGKISINPQIFSTTKIKQQLKEKDVEDWVNEIKFPQSKLYDYPSNLNLAEIHRQSCYIQKEKTFTQNVSKCECCQQKIKFKQYDILTVDMYEVMKYDYGISTPLYFSILKLHLVVLLVLGLSFGIYFCYLTSKICSDENFWVNSPFDFQKDCKIQHSTFILPQEIIVDYQVQNGHHLSYLIYTFLCFLSIMMTPFMHEIVIRANQIKYWSFEQTNHSSQDKLTLYIKHLPKKLSEIEILIYIHSALQEESQNQLNGNPLNELVYIYDTHQVKEINRQRQLNYIKFLIASQKLKEDINNTNLKNEFIELIVQLMYQTKQINAVMKAGFPFTNKAIVKLNDRKVADQVYKHYSKSIFKRMVTSSRAMLGQVEEYKKQQLKLELSQPMITDMQSNLGSSALKEFPAGHLTQTSQSDNESQNLTKSLLDIMEFSQQFEIEMPEKIDENKHLSIQRGFKQDDIYWENIGMHTIRRFILRVMTTSVSLIFGSISILLYCFLFTMQQYSESVIYEKLFAFGIVFVSVFSSIIVVMMTLKSKRSTYSLQEKNINTFTIPISFFCVVCFPYILGLWWAEGFRDINAIYTLFLLSRIRIISKGLISMFHIRWISYWLRKRKIIKSFNKFNYFQNQLNQQMTPPFFPIRSRISYIFFVFCTGLLMLLLGPFILVFCLIFQLIIYFYDKHCILNVYRVDKQFTFELFSYLIKVMQIIMMPVYAYVYISLLKSVIHQAQKYDKLYNYEYHFLLAAFIIAGTLFLMYIFLRKQIADYFVFNILGYKIDTTEKIEIVEKSYYESYQEYFDKLGVEELTQILIDTFKSMPYQ